jgi:uncharacterized ubiquitin-like protein YukD
MFLLNFVPSWLLGFSVNIIIIVGGISFVISLFLESFARYIPWIIPHKTLLQVLGILLLVLGVYLKGAADMEVKWRDRVTEMETKVALAEAESKINNSKVQIKIVEKTRYVKENQIKIDQQIVNENIQHISFDFWNTIVRPNRLFKEKRAELIGTLFNNQFSK